MGLNLLSNERPAQAVRGKLRTGHSQYGGCQIVILFNDQI